MVVFHSYVSLPEGNCYITIPGASLCHPGPPRSWACTSAVACVEPQALVPKKWGKTVDGEAHGKKGLPP